MTTATGTQSDLFAWGKDLERENKRIAEINAQRARNRGYLVFATDPSKGVDSAEYQQVYATEARTPNQAIAKVRPPAEGRRLQTFLTTGKYGTSWQTPAGWRRPDGWESHAGATASRRAHRHSHYGAAVWQALSRRLTIVRVLPGLDVAAVPRGSD